MQPLLAAARRIDRVFELLRVARLGQGLVGRPDRAQCECLVRVPGQNDPHRLGLRVADAVQQLGAVDPGHPHIADDHVVTGGGELLEGLGAALAEGHVPLAAVATQHPPQAGQHIGLVVDKEDVGHGCSEA